MVNGKNVLSNRPCHHDDYGVLLSSFLYVQDFNNNNNNANNNKKHQRQHQEEKEQNRSRSRRIENDEGIFLE